tara:strand:- start:393 stop:593 length:201 start_codon:yes stop_codon:yes gene_type:complete
MNTNKLTYTKFKYANFFIQQGLDRTRSVDIDKAIKPAIRKNDTSHLEALDLSSFEKSLVIKAFTNI